MNLHLNSELSSRISELSRRTGFSPLTLIHQAIEEFLERNADERCLMIQSSIRIGDYEPQ